MAALRSPRIVQQTQPLCSSTISSSIRCSKETPQQCGLTAAEKTGDHVDRNERCLFGSHCFMPCAAFAPSAQLAKDQGDRTLCPEYALPLARPEPDHRQFQFGQCDYSIDILRLPSPRASDRTRRG